MNSSKIAYSFGGVLILGTVLSSFFSTDPRWMNWHFSRLGEGNTFSSEIFNTALLIASLLAFILGLSLKDNISQISDKSNINIDRAKTIIYKSFSVATVCLIGVAFFPFDRFPMIHNIFGYSMLFMFLRLCVSMPKVLPIFSKRFNLYSRLVVACVIICYTLFAAMKMITLLAVEFVMFSYFYLWIILFIRGLSREFKKGDNPISGKSPYEY